MVVNTRDNLRLKFFSWNRDNLLQGFFSLLNIFRLIKTLRICQLSQPRNSITKIVCIKYQRLDGCIEPAHCATVQFVQFCVGQLGCLAYLYPLLSRKFQRSRHSWKPSCSNLFGRKEYTAVGYSNCDSTEPLLTALQDLVLGCFKHTTSIPHTECG